MDSKSLGNLYGFFRLFREITIQRPHGRGRFCVMPNQQTNVLGAPLKCCCMRPLTGYYRDGHCRTGPGDVGLHTVCVEMTDEFLNFSRLRGNDLSTPAPEFMPKRKERATGLW